MTKELRRKNSLSAPTPEQTKMLAAWTADALEMMPYFARIILATRPVSAPGLGTFAVDASYRMYIDFEAVAKQGHLWCVESILHEASHLWADHAALPAELGDANPQAINISADLAINDDLDEAGCVTFRHDNMLPRNIGEANGQTPHHYFRVLMAKMAAAKANPTAPKPQVPQDVKLTVRPGAIQTGTAKGTILTVVASAPFIDTANYSVMVGDATGSMLSISDEDATKGTVTFTLDSDLPAGMYGVMVSSGSTSAAGTFTVADPSIRLVPSKIEGGWTAPYPVNVIGTFTDFDDTNVVVTVTDEQGVAQPVGKVRTISATEVMFDLTALIADGMYAVNVTDTVRGETYTAPLPVGLPVLRLDPQSLPTGHLPGTLVTAEATDFPLDASTTFDVLALPFGAPVPAAFGSVKVTGPDHADLTLAVTLPEGSYVVVGTTQTPAGPVQAVGQIAVTDQQSDESQPGGGDGQGGEQAEGGEGGGGEQGQPFRGCGSGSGGEAWDGELDPDDDLDGSAAGASHAEKELIAIQTAAAVQDYIAKGRGTVPGGIAERANKILAPSQTPWQQLLGAMVRRAVGKQKGRRDVEWRRRNRRKHQATILTATGVKKVVYPGSVAPKIKIGIIRDTSGSMSLSDLAAVTREVEAISKRLGVTGDDLMVYDVDAGFYGGVPFKNAKSIENVRGRGGTDMRVGIDAVCALPKAERPDVIVLLSDCGTPWPSEKPAIPTIVAVVPQRWSDSDSKAAAAARAKEYAGHIPDFLDVVVVAPGDK